MSKKNEISIATEAQEQEMLFRYCAVEIGRYPMLANLFHIPNGGTRNKREAVRLKREGVRAGYPDLALDYPSCGKHGLRIELKRTKGYSIQPEQKDWIIRLNNAGYAAVFCYGWENAWEVIKSYINGNIETIEYAIQKSMAKANNKNTHSRV